MTNQYAAGGNTDAALDPRHSLPEVLKRLDVEWGGSFAAQRAQIERSVERIQQVVSHMRTKLDNLDSYCALMDSDADAALFHLRSFADHAEYSNSLGTDYSELVALTARVTGIIEGLRDAVTIAPQDRGR